MKKVIVVILAVAVCLSLMFAIYNIKSFENLVRPPKLSGENRLLQHAFEQSVTNSDGIVMKNPLSGLYTSSYLFFDMNNDGQEEAFVFYSDLSEDNLACVSIFKKVGKEWIFVSKIKGQTEDFYEVNFADINGDNVSEILLSWKSNENIESVRATDFGVLGNRVLSVYSFDGISTTLLKTESYSNIYVSDFNKDGSDDFLFVNLSFSGQEKKTIGRILSFNKDYSVARELSVVLTGLLEVYNIATDSVTENQNEFTRIFIDGAISERGVITEVIKVSHNDFELSLPLYEMNQSQHPVTLRDTRLFSMDFDGDNIIEIPTLELFPGAVRIEKGTSERSSLNLTVWNELNNSGISVDKKCVVNTSYEYMLIIDDSWINMISAIYDYNNSTLTFYYLKDDGEFDEEIFSLRAFSNPEWQNDDAGYDKLVENSAYVYGYRFNNADLQKDFEDYLKENFRVYS